MSNTTSPFTAATSKFAYAQAFSGDNARRHHSVGLFGRLAQRRNRTRVTSA